MLDPGEDPLSLTSENWSLSEWNGRLILQAWDTHRNLTRKIVALGPQRRDRITLITERFPRATAETQIADLAGATGPELRRKASRASFRDRFRLLLTRDFPAWRIKDVSTDANLEESLSPSFVRAFMMRGSGSAIHGIAAIAAPPDTLDFAAIVPFALIWLDYLRRRERAALIPRLLIYVPLCRERAAAFRAAIIDRSTVACELYLYDPHDVAGRIDFADVGNLDSTLPLCHNPAAPNLETAMLAGLPPQVDRVEQSDGAVSLRIHGLEFGRISAHRLSCGLNRKRPCSAATLIAMANEIARLRRPDAEDRQHPLFAQYPEGWLESRVRTNLQIIDPSLQPAPIYGQVPVFAGPERGIIDLLAIDDTGRLVIIELKATADLQLPFQALDYWLRVRKHLAAGDFERLGYFTGRTVRHEPPRIILVAPALEFHSTTEVMLRALPPALEIVRVGLAANWRAELRVMFRLTGSERP